jgi:hypothetical protein
MRLRLLTTQSGRLAAGALMAFLSACSARDTSMPRTEPVPPSLVAGVGEDVVDGQGSVPCGAADEASRRTAEQKALQDAVKRAAAAYGAVADELRIEDVVARHRVERFWQEQGECFARVQAVVQTSQLQRSAREQTREALHAVGRPLIAFAISSYRILPNTAVTTKRSAAEIIDSLQQELITRGFDVRRSLKARTEALVGGGGEVLDISSAERDRIAAAAMRDGVVFLVQGEIKVSDESKRRNV